MSGGEAGKEIGIPKRKREREKERESSTDKSNVCHVKRTAFQGLAIFMHL